MNYTNENSVPMIVHFDRVDAKIYDLEHYKPCQQ